MRHAGRAARKRERSSAIAGAVDKEDERKNIADGTKQWKTFASEARYLFLKRV